MAKVLPNVLIVGSIGIDTIETHDEIEKDIFGGAATYASLAASYLSQPIILATCGTDATKKQIDDLEKFGIDTNHILKDGKTFRWYARYDKQGTAHTLKTELDGVTNKFPQVMSNPPKFALLANHNPEIHLKVLSQLDTDTFTLADTIEFWIDAMPKKVKQVFSKVDALSITEAEAKKLAGTHNTILAGKYMLSLGKKKFVVIKKGEHGAITFFPSTNSEQVDIFFSPGYPLENVKDPTGAGDSLAGGVISYLAYHNTIDCSKIKKAVVYGSMISSYVAENIGTKYRQNTSFGDIQNRAKYIKKCLV